MADKNIVIIGAGVIGLTAALTLSRKPGFNVTVVAKHMPGDLDIEYASPWAGACYLPFSAEGTLGAQLEETSWAELARLAKNVPESGLHLEKCILYSREKDMTTDVGQWQQHLHNPDAWWKSFVPAFRALSGSEIPSGYDTGLTFTTVNINPALYLPWLASRCIAQGATITRGIVPHIAQAGRFHSTGRADLVLNCTGLAARSLGGVMDKAMTPARGQTVLVRGAPGLMLGNSGTDDGQDEAVYLITRACGGGTILGGSYQLGNEDPKVDEALAERIMKRAKDLWAVAAEKEGRDPPGELSVVRHGVGLRPVREGGPRIEKEVVDGVHVVHCYGHGGAGYETSYGSIMIVEKLVDEMLMMNGAK